ncbi:MAG: histidine--tRNA ligase [bacterium]|nr:histidine--tRNA ligase [bacterium]
MIKPQTLKGFRDFLPKEARKRQYVINTLKEVFESYGFEPLETPALEYEEVLLGKYGEEGDKLMYRFEDLGGRKVALRYDQTVPLARVVAQYTGILGMPFKRYQIQPVWRAENPQKGRFREFLQCDIDTVGSSSPLTDAEIISLAINALEKLEFKDVKILVNDRSIFSSKELTGVITPEKIPAVIRTIDKIKKIGREGVLTELEKLGFGSERGTYLIQTIENAKPIQKLAEIFSLLEKMGVDKSKFQFSPTLARGLDYYTGTIFEAEIEGYSAGSVAGGGRFDSLIGMFCGQSIPAVGISFGFDRLIEAMDQLNLFPQNITSSTTKVLVTIFNPDLLNKSLEITLLLYRNKVPAEIYLPTGKAGLEENTPLDKQIKYADRKGIPYVVIIGPEEAATDEVTIKNLATGEQKRVKIEEITSVIQ